MKGISSPLDCSFYIGPNSQPQLYTSILSKSPTMRKGSWGAIKP